jgi:hypothetical protein
MRNTAVRRSAALVSAIRTDRAGAACTNPGDGSMKNLAMRLAVAVSCAAALGTMGCAYYGYPVAVSAPASFERSFSAAAGAMRDQGLTLSVEDRSSGTIVGSIGAGSVTANVRQQADGSVRVQFDATGARDPALIERVSRSYDSRMGR